MDHAPENALPFAAVEHDVTHEDTFDHDRLVALVDGLERDIALIEGAMVDVEAREFASANAALDVLDGVSTA